MVSCPTWAKNLKWYLLLTSLRYIYLDETKEGFENYIIYAPYITVTEVCKDRLHFYSNESAFYILGGSFIYVLPILPTISDLFGFLLITYLPVSVLYFLSIQLAYRA